ncbi:unnamed protein product, partial [Amoebophrya sp. A25]
QEEERRAAARARAPQDYSFMARAREIWTNRKVSAPYLTLGNLAEFLHAFITAVVEPLYTKSLFLAASATTGKAIHGNKKAATLSPDVLRLSTERYLLLLDWVADTTPTAERLRFNVATEANLLVLGKLKNLASVGESFLTENPSLPSLGQTAVASFSSTSEHQGIMNHGDDPVLPNPFSTSTMPLVIMYQPIDFRRHAGGLPHPGTNFLQDVGGQGHATLGLQATSSSPSFPPTSLLDSAETLLANVNIEDIKTPSGSEADNDEFLGALRNQFEQGLRLSSSPSPILGGGSNTGPVTVYSPRSCTNSSVGPSGGVVGGNEYYSGECPSPTAPSPPTQNNSRNLTEERELFPEVH